MKDIVWIGPLILWIITSILLIIRIEEVKRLKEL